MCTYLTYFIMLYNFKIFKAIIWNEGVVTYLVLFLQDLQNYVSQVLEGEDHLKFLNFPPLSPHHLGEN